MIETHTGPGRRVWQGISEHEVGRPRLRPRHNPVPANYGGAQLFPFASQGVTPDGQAITLQLLAWQLRDTYIVLQGQTWNTPLTLFVSGIGGNLYEFGATSNQGPAKPVMLANINSNSGLLPSPQSFLATHMTQILRGDIFPADILNLAYSTYYKFQAGDQDWVYLEGFACRIPGAQYQVYMGAVGSTYTATVEGLGWPTVHNAASLRSGLSDPSLGGAEDQGYNISQNKQFKVVVDPTQFSFTGAAVASGSWATTATASGGKGVQSTVVLEGVLARSQNG